MKHTVKQRLHTIIFGTTTPAGRRFDLVLIFLILFSLVVAMAESVASVRTDIPFILRLIEWSLTVAFTAEYALRIYCSPRRSRYIFSFFGVVDLIAILPFFLSLFAPGMGYLRVIRILRVARIFRILKLTRYLEEVRFLQHAIIQSRRKIAVFLMFVLMLVLLAGSLMYLVEGEANGFSSIPKSVYWAIVTLTTVGYGDLSPATPVGQGIASLIMLLGYSIIAVPTGLVVAGAFSGKRSDAPARAPGIGPQRPEANGVCGICGSSGHDGDAVFCKHCGARIGP